VSGTPNTLFHYTHFTHHRQEISHGLENAKISDFELTESETTALLCTLPCELLIQALKELRGLRQLQAAILASRDLFLAYKSSRTLVRQQVFTNEFLDLGRLPSPSPTIQDGKCSTCSNLKRAQSRIGELESKNPADGLILRACLWNDLLEHALFESDAVQDVINSGSTFDNRLPAYAECIGVFTEWSLALNSAYRRDNQRRKAQHIGTQTLDALTTIAAACGPDSRKLNRNILEWLSSIMADCAAHHDHDAGFVFFQGIWDYFTQVKSDSLLAEIQGKHVFEIIKSLEWFCADIDPESCSKSHEIEPQAWQFMHRHISQSHADGNFCLDCSFTVGSLTSTSLFLHTDLDVLTAYQRSIWRDLPPRSQIFVNWSKL
jgi:hypothetical protein